MYRKFIIHYFLLILIIAVGAIPVFIFIFKVKEISTINSIVSYQLAKNAIYGTALNQDTFQYKLELIKQTKPNLVAIGSSRVMQLREEFFNASFISAGGAVNHLNEGIIFLQEMIKVHRPKMILLGLDFWWFNEKFSQPQFFNHEETTNKFFIMKILRPLKWLLTNKITFSQFYNVILDNNKNEVTSYYNIGINALVSSTGFRKDGSYFYSKIIYGLEKNDDSKFFNTINRIEHGNSRFEYGDVVSNERLSYLLEFIKICEQNNIELIIFIPPVSNRIHEKIEKMSDKYKFIEDLKNIVEKLNGFNYHNPSKIDSSDCEFIDGFHGGDLTYQKIILDIAKKNISLTNRINRDFIESNIKKFEGFAQTDSQKYSKMKEIDFLDIGCKK